MKRARNGDTESMGVLFERHRGSLFGSFVRRIGDPSQAEDMVQDTFVRAFKYRDSFRPDQAFLPWLHQIARNVLYAALKKQGRQHGTPADDHELLSQVPCSSQSPYQASAQSAEKDFLYAALERLPEEQRQLIILRRIQNLDYEEIAQLLDCKIGPLKVRVHRAFLKLRKIVTEQSDALKPHEL
jgi:RNA polymerase sigma factor (sigma-70 family)